MIAKLKDTLLLVGDGMSDRASLRAIFESSYNLLEAENAAQACMLLEQNKNCIAAVVADLPLGGDNGLHQLVMACDPGTEFEIPVIAVITPLGTGEREEQAFALGAADVVLKPYAPAIMQKRIQVIMDLYLHKWHLAKLVDEQSATIRNTNQVMVDALSAIIEHRSSESGNHVLRIRRFTRILLEEVARSCPEYALTGATMDIIANAAALHDIGKISIPDAILNKPGKLTAEEFELMKTHTTIGSELIQTLSGMGDVEYLRYAYNICLYHHERWNGGGYPHGLVGDEIPICAQVVSIADVFDALTTPRVYKPAYPFAQAFNMILNNECGAFSGKLLECLKRVRNQFVELAHQYADGLSPKSEAIAVPLPRPDWKNNPLSAVQLSQIKYHTLMHYMDATVLELDLDNRIFHVVYNPNPDLDTIVQTAHFGDVMDFMLHVHVHPEDEARLREVRDFMAEEFFRLNLRRRSFVWRIFSPTRGEYVPYEMTFLRVNTGNEEQRIATVVWRRLEKTLAEHKDLQQSGLHASPALYGLVSSALRCSGDAFLTIDAGAKDLYHLTGYTEEEIRTQFDNKLLNLVFPEDRELFSRAMQEQLNQGGRAECEYRLLRKNAEPLWVLDKSRVYIEADDQEYIYHAIRDNARGKAQEHELKNTIERNQIIIDQSGGIIFEWDILSDTMYCSHKWKEHFGYEPVSRNYGRQMGIATHFHPDDLPMIRSAIEEIKSHSATLSVDVRIADANAKYLWTRITATAYLDENGELTRIVGFLQDIDALKRAEQALKERAERDSLTTLLNKASTQQLITEYLEEREPDSLSALLILDLDNFKAINDNYGHLYGDAVLTQVGHGLKRLFRPNDIIGRIGGDEFMILMRDIPGRELVYNRCEQLLDTFRKLLEKNAPNLNASCSIGVALIPEHGTDYAELFRRADEALYLSKSQGKNGWTVYDPQGQAAAALSNAARDMTRIDSDEQPGMANASFVRFVFQRLYESDNVIRTFDEILAYMGEQLNVSRVYIFENNEDNTTCSNTFEWCNEGVAPEIDNLQDVSYIDDIAGWQNVFNEEGVFYCTDVTTLEPHFWAILEPQGIKSMLQCAILDNGVFRGYVGFDECNVHRLWTQAQIDLLKFLAEVLALFLLKKRTQDKLQAQAKSMRDILDLQDEWIYVIDPDTCEIKFLNAKIKQIAPKSRVGKICYSAFMGRRSRCSNCPAVKGTDSPQLIENAKLGVRVNAHASDIVWDGKNACLMTCYDLTDK